MKLLAGIVVMAFGLCLIGLAVTLVVRPPLARRFLESFASSARAHVTEQVVRLVAGAALVVLAPAMTFPRMFTVLGWLLVVTAVGLLLLPWRWHQKFGTWAIPFAIRHRKLQALGAFLLGAVILHGALRAFFP